MARPKKYTEEFIKDEAGALLKYAKVTTIPFEKEFASKRGYSSQRISEFATESDEFSEALKKMKDIQEVKIVRAALSGKINTTMAIFTLKNVAGWRDALKMDSLADQSQEERPIYRIVHFGRTGETGDSSSSRVTGINTPVVDRDVSST